MKLTSVFAAVAAGAALASAAPMRVIVVSSSAQELKPLHLRFGHAAAGATIPQAMDSMPSMPAKAPSRRPCHGLQAKVSNMFRTAFGLPTIEELEKGRFIEPFRPKLEKGRFVPVAGNNGSPTFIEPLRPMEDGKGWYGRTKGGDKIEILPAPGFDGKRPYQTPGHPMFDGPIPPPYHDHHHSHHRHHAHMHGEPGEEGFMYRASAAILSLGPWEGRAVAFVLGCGLGVLIRMFWVICVVLIRAFSGRGEEVQYVTVAVIEDEEDAPRSTPPAYVYPVDEKVAIDAKPATLADN